MDGSGLNNRVLKILSQSSHKAAVDLLGMRISTNIKDKFVEIMITETEAYGRKTTDKMSLFNTYKNIPTSLTLGPPYISVLKSYGSNRSMFLLSGKKGFGEAVLIRSGIILIGKKHIEARRKVKMKNDKLNGPGNITKGLSISDVNDGNSIISGPIDISPRIHPVDQAIAKQRKNAKRNDKNLWRFTLILK
tara:strand:+ start:571 stop:1143 length:573 start_codon:yes stop_codon:yes gene_type:complete